MTTDDTDLPLWEPRATGLTIVPGLSWPEWEEKWLVLDRTQRSINWWLGDALIYAEDTFGERWSQAVDAEFREQHERCMRVSRLIPPPERREAFSWSSHREVAALSSEERAEIFDLAEAQGWRSREIRDEVQRRKAARKTNGGPPLDDTSPADEPPLPLEPDQNSTWNEPDDGDTFGDPQDIDGSAAPAPPQNGYGNGASDTTYPPNGSPAPAQGDRADDIRALIAAVRRLAPDLSDAWRMEAFRIEGRESTVKLVRGDQLAVGIGPSLPCALIEASLSALLSDLGAG